MTATNPEVGTTGEAAKPGKPASNGKGKAKNGMSDAHKLALAEGREHGRIVNQYLDALDAHKPKRGRKVTPEAIQERIVKVDADLLTAKPSERLNLVQQKMDLEAQLRRTETNTAIDELEKQFVKVAKPYAERKGLSYAAFREVGVSPEVLKKAGLERKVA